MLAIVKKNGPRLRSLKRWLFGARPELLARCPVLIIDDEADQASVNTAKPDRQPTLINGLIREIVNGLPEVRLRRIHGDTVRQRPDRSGGLRGSLSRATSSSIFRGPTFYIGPEAIFGREPLEFDAEDVGDDGHDFVRSVPIEELDGPSAQGRRQPARLRARASRDSLEMRLRYFLLSTAARRVRGSGNPHATALVHTSQHIDVHERMAERDRRPPRGRLASGSPRVIQRSSRSSRRMWESECERVPAGDFGLEPVAWEDVARCPAARSRRRPSSSPTTRAARSDCTSTMTHPRVIVAVGGNTLSRGLTLEGLSVSFFVRTRIRVRHAAPDGPLVRLPRRICRSDADLDDRRDARVVPPPRHGRSRRSATTSSATRREHVTPEELGVRIRTHPKLAITAAAKMQHARSAHKHRTPVAGSRPSSSTTVTRHGLRTTSTPRRALVEAAELGDAADGAAGDHGHRARVEREHHRVSRRLSLPREQPRSRRRADQPVHPRPRRRTGS